MKENIKIDLTYQLSREMLNKFLETMATDKNYEKFGHFGTHLDSMDREFPLDDCERNGKIFDVTSVKGRDIEIGDVNISKIAKDDFVIFHTGFLKEKGYGTPEYFRGYIELSDMLIHRLIDKKVSLIGIDTPAIRNSSEHIQADRYCADNGVFVIENLDNLDKLLKESTNKTFVVHTYPIAIKGSTGLPCRVIAEIKSQ